MNKKDVWPLTCKLTIESEQNITPARTSTEVSVQPFFTFQQKTLNVPDILTYTLQIQKEDG